MILPLQWLHSKAVHVTSIYMVTKVKLTTFTMKDQQSTVEGISGLSLAAFLN